MKTYNVKFEYDFCYAEVEIPAKSVKDALATARDMHENDEFGELIIDANYYDEAGDLQSIVVYNEDKPETIFYEPHVLLEMAAQELLKAAVLAEDALSELARLDDGTCSISALNALRAAIKSATKGVGNGRS